MVRVKICGIRDLETAQAAVEAGADALGFVFAESRRKIDPEQARDIISKLPPLISCIGVFANQPIEQVNQIARVAGLDGLQLHGDEDPAYCDHMHRPVIKAFCIGSEQDLQRLSAFSRVRGYLLDTLVDTGELGGTGKTFDWRLARNTNASIILAGGLTPENVARAIGQAQPYAVDVSSGVERDGSKCVERIRAFIAAVKTSVHGLGHETAGKAATSDESPDRRKSP